MEFLRAVRRKSLLSETIYILLNIALGLTVLGVVWAINSPLPAFALVLLSKWRVLAVRPRYWFAHVQANMVDLIVSLSFVVLLYAAGGSGGRTVVVTQIILTILYILWLLVLKPRTRRALVVAQAAVALFIGTAALYMGAYEWPSSVVVAMMWIIGYSSARHVLAAYSEDQLTFISFMWALLMAELGWLAYHWTIAYHLPFVSGIELPQVALVAIALGFMAERGYNSFVHHGVIRMADILMPTLLSLSVIVTLYLAFNGVNSGSI
jgi:hypothetical protein